MKYMFYEKESETRARVNLIYYVTPPQDLLDQNNWIQVDRLSEPEPIEGKWATTYSNPQTQEIWYEYKDIPKSPEVAELEKLREELETFKGEQETTKAMNAQMLLMLVDASVL